MALITCPECNGQVSDKATVCPHCGYPLEGSDQEKEQLISELTDVLKSKTDNTAANQAHPQRELDEISSEKQQPPVPQPRDLKQESKSSSGNGLIWGLILGMAVIVIIVISVATKDPYSSSSNTKTSGRSSYSSSSSSSSYSSSSSKKYDEDDIKAGVYVLAKKCVKNHLKAPSTAEFTAMSDCGFSKGEGNIYMMTGYVDSQNSFGAMLQEQWSIMAEVSGDKVSLVMLTIGDEMYFE